jgi:hypothetical protein
VESHLPRIPQLIRNDIAHSCSPRGRSPTEASNSEPRPMSRCSDTSRDHSSLQTKEFLTSSCLANTLQSNTARTRKAVEQLPDWYELSGTTLRGSYRRSRPFAGTAVEEISQAETRRERTVQRMLTDTKTTQVSKQQRPNLIRQLEIANAGRRSTQSNNSLSNLDPLNKKQHEKRSFYTRAF